MQTDQTLLEQMRISEFEVEHRQALLSFTQADIKALLSCKAVIEQNIDPLVAEFYRLQTSVTEISLLIGDADTLDRLRKAQRRYVLDLFSGVYDLEYVNNRLRIGLVHKRIGVEPKLYLSAVHTLRELLYKAICNALPVGSEREAAVAALVLQHINNDTCIMLSHIHSKTRSWPCDRLNCISPMRIAS